MPNKKTKVTKRTKTYGGNPERVNGDAWYYESPRTIEVIHWSGESGERKVHRIRIPFSKLLRSMRRQGFVK